MISRARWAAGSLLVVVAVPLAAQSSGDADVLARIREEASHYPLTRSCCSVQFSAICAARV